MENWQLYQQARRAAASCGELRIAAGGWEELGDPETRAGWAVPGWRAWLDGLLGEKQPEGRRKAEGLGAAASIIISSNGAT